MSTTTFIIPRRQLADILARIADTTPTRSLKPILQDVKISGVYDGKVSFYATDLERYHTETCEVNEWTGSVTEVCVNARQLRKAVTGSKSKEIALSIGKESVSVYGMLIPVGHSAQDMPTAPDVEAEYMRCPSAQELLRLFTHTMYACDVNSTRYSLGGVFVEMDKSTIECAFPDYLRFVATNGQRLATDYVGMKGPTELATAILPTNACKSAVKALRKAEQCALSLTNDQYTSLDVLCKDGTEVSFVFRLIGEMIQKKEGWTWIPGRFPRWRDVIPSHIDSVCHVEADELAGLMTKAKQCTTDEDRAASIGVNDGEFRVGTGQPDTGQYVGRIAAKLNKAFSSPERGRDTFETKLDCKFVLDVAKSCKGVKLEISGSYPESIVRFDSSDGSTHLIMPLGPNGK